MKVLILLAASLVAVAQTASFVAVSSRTSVTSDKLTLQQNQDTPVYAQAVRAVILSTVDGTVVVQRGGTAPTATAVTIVRTDDGARFSACSAYGASNVGSGTAISVVYKLTANIPLILDMTATAINGPGTTKNITISTALSGSGDVQTALYWKEQSQ